jgi:KaiC/GvpD/RAD55 family RecA-like ATPase
MSDFNRIRDALNFIPSDDRDTWVKMGMAIKSEVGENGFPLWDLWSQQWDFYNPRDAKTAWKSFDLNGTVTIATLFYEAKERGWRDLNLAKDNSSNICNHLSSPPTQTTKPSTSMARDILPLAIWDSSQPATEEHPYIIAKRGHPDGLRMVNTYDDAKIAGHSVAGWLVLPVLSLAGELRTLQLIPPPGIGRKLNMPGASFGDGMFVVGNLTHSPRVFIVEGIGQAWACWSATGHAAVVCFGAGRMGTVATLLRKRFPALSLVLVPDRDKEVQAAEIARSISGEWVELPDDKPANYDVNDFAADYGIEELADLLDKVRSPAMRYKVLSADDLMKVPPLRWLVRGVMPANGLACIYGASTSGKSFLALDMCAAVADGLEWFDCRVTAAPVVYVALEGERGFNQRVKAWQLHHQRDLPTALRFIMQPLDMRKPDDVAELIDAVIASGSAGGLLVIDTLNRAAGGADENSSADMGQLIDSAKVLQSQLGGTVLLVHHSGKDASKGLRGHSSLHAALDAAIEVTRNDDRREWRIAKSKDDDDSAAYQFRLVVVEIDTDEHGDTVTSCVVEADIRPSAMKRMKLPQGPTQKLAHDALGELLRESKHFGKAGAPAGRPCVELDAAALATADRLTCRSDQRQFQSRRAITAMVSKGLYQVREGWLWDCQ